MSDYNEYCKRMAARAREQGCMASVYDADVARQTDDWPSNPSTDQMTYFADTFSALASIYGTMVPLSAVRKCISGSKESVDRIIAAARATGLYCLEASEGRYGIPSELAEAAYTDQYGTYHYISRR